MTHVEQLKAHLAGASQDTNPTLRLAHLGAARSAYEKALAELLDLKILLEGREGEETRLLGLEKR